MMDWREGIERRRVCVEGWQPSHCYLPVVEQIGTAAERSDCCGDWASADRWPPPSVGHWAVCRVHTRTKLLTAHVHDRHTACRKSGGQARFDLGRLVLRALLFLSSTRWWTRPIWPRAKAQQPASSTYGGTEEISVDALHLGAKMTYALDRGCRRQRSCRTNYRAQIQKNVCVQEWCWRCQFICLTALKISSVGSIKNMSTLTVCIIMRPLSPYF